jgi:hypothetical protein
MNQESMRPLFGRIAREITYVSLSARAAVHHAIQLTAKTSHGAVACVNPRVSAALFNAKAICSILGQAVRATAAENFI